MNFARVSGLLVAASLIFSTGCSVVVGNVKPIDEKSTQYGVADLSKANPDWKKLDTAKATAQAESVKEQDVSPTEVSDVAYQSQSTASIISLDSACRRETSEESARRDLRSLTDLLLLGITDVSLRQEEGLDVQKTPALQTTIRGKLNGDSMQLRTVVLKRESCVYDLVYLARPAAFEKHLPDFSHFVASLRLK